ncbi:putative homeodomain transcription factor isoform X2 [Cimex lectularius]|uniref:PHTF1/2 N-terminal domain-containing protein n=1 Tax=Cimex lectularius TaxID=79782 RepID=A0A8I6RZX6_CIMLE|nr:putative homeodomain transcription factor isoform X2 [Cimex lectularius]
MNGCTLHREMTVVATVTARIARYQKKIGTYDKQEWEKTVEQRILSGFTHVPKKTAKLKTDLIDVDLVRGSSFTKAKPKHGLLKVTRLALMRLIFLPLYIEWWSHQTSFKMFFILLILYILQMANMAMYFYAYYNLPEGTIKCVNTSEVVIPVAMMVILAILHSQIVSPRSSGAKDLAPFDSKARRIKRTKRRPPKLVGSEKPSECSSEFNALATDSSNKFNMRVRLRKLSFEDSNKNNIRRRRSVGWETSSAKPSLSPAKEESKGSPHHDQRNQRDESVNPQDDDGFESLNSHGSNEERAVEASDNSVIAKENEQEVKKAEPEAVFRNNWLEQSARRASIGCNHLSSGETDHQDSDSEGSNEPVQERLIVRRRGLLQSLHLAVVGETQAESSYNSSDEGETGSFCPALTEGTTSAAEWIGITTNSEDCSVSSEIDEHPFASEFHMSPSAILSPSCAASDKVSCTMWEKREVKKAELSVLDISSAIIARVEAMPEHIDYFYAGIFVSIFLGLVPSLYRLTEAALPAFPDCFGDPNPPSALLEYLASLFYITFGTNTWEMVITLITLFERTAISSLFFFLIVVAERTFKQRFLYAKFFSHLTSFRRARKSELPHFRLNKVRNIKTWLSVRSYLRKRGPQHSVDVIVSSVFLITLLLLSYLAVEHLKESEKMSPHCNIEALVWSVILSFFLLRFMTLGTKVNKKYRNLSVLITEQINLYLQIEQKPNKKEELMVANSVLKLAADLLKELESPYKISGFSANPYLYTITKVVILSALSGVLSEMLGFKLKLHKIKIK